MKPRVRLARKGLQAVGQQRAQVFGLTPDTCGGSMSGVHLRGAWRIRVLQNPTGHCAGYMPCDRVA